MARRGQHRRGRAQRRARETIPNDKHFKKKLVLSVVLLAQAAGDEEAEVTALLIALLTLRERRAAHDERRSYYRRRGPYDHEKRQELFDLIMQLAPESWFKAWFRMEREAFWRLHGHIKDDPIFVSTGRKPQRKPRYQLAAFLCRMGALSNIKAAGFCAIAEGSVRLYTWRTVHAIRKLRPLFLAWPDEERRDSISARMATAGFPGCLGSGDGTYFQLEDKPLVNGFAYFCHKKFYAISIQATVDDRGIITSYDFGWPGSVQDSRVFKESHLWNHREEYFRAHEYILVDKGYPLTPFAIRPFHDHDLTNDSGEARCRKRWNQTLSSQRIFVEHAFGRLKGRFQWLRCIPDRDFQEIYHTVEALFVLHNFLESRHDDPTTIEGFHGEVDDPTLGPIYNDVAHMDLDVDDLYRAGLVRRKLLLDLRTEMDTV